MEVVDAGELVDELGGLLVVVLDDVVVVVELVGVDVELEAGADVVEAGGRHSSAPAGRPGGAPGSGHGVGVQSPDPPLLAEISMLKPPLDE